MLPLHTLELAGDANAVVDDALDHHLRRLADQKSFTVHQLNGGIGIFFDEFDVVGIEKEFRLIDTGQLDHGRAPGNENRLNAVVGATNGRRKIGCLPGEEGTRKTATIRLPRT